MTISLIFAAWAFSGVVPLIWASWDYERFTWGDLLTCAVLGTLCGPLAAVVILSVVVTGYLEYSGFLRRPIFGKRRHD